jgi:hypothetical protein
VIACPGQAVLELQAPLGDHDAGFSGVGAVRNDLWLRGRRLNLLSVSDGRGRSGRKWLLFCYLCEPYCVPRATESAAARPVDARGGRENIKEVGAAGYALGGSSIRMGSLDRSETLALFVMDKLRPARGSVGGFGMIEEAGRLAIGRRMPSCPA